MINPLKLFSFWAVLLYSIFLALQIFTLAGLGIMLVMAVAGPYVWGLIPYIVLVALVLDVLRKRLPIFFLIIPLFLFGAYYIQYFKQAASLEKIQQELVSQNPQQIIEFDSKTQILMMDNAEWFVRTHKVPMVFERNKTSSTEGRAHMLVTKEVCKELQAGGLPSRYTEKIGKYFCSKSIHLPETGNILGRKLNSIKVIDLPVHINKEIILVEIDDSAEKNNKKNYRRRLEISQSSHIDLDRISDLPTNIKTYKFSYKNVLLGTFQTLEAYPLSALPMYTVGCGLNSASPSWECFASFNRKKKVINTFPSKVDASVHGQNPVGVLLGIGAYTAQEYERFNDYLENLEVIGALVREERNEKPDDLDKWGIHKGNPYSPEIGEHDGYPSFKGRVGGRKDGMPFRDFIEEHEGKIVYIEIDVELSVNKNYFGISGVCRTGEQCSSRTDNSYSFQYEGGRPYHPEEKGRFKGFYRVGEKVLSHYNPSDRDTRTILTFVPSANLSRDVINNGSPH